MGKLTLQLPDRPLTRILGKVGQKISLGHRLCSAFLPGLENRKTSVPPGPPRDPVEEEGAPALRAKTQAPSIPARSHRNRGPTVKSTSWGPEKLTGLAKPPCGRLAHWEGTMSDKSNDDT